MSEDITGYSTRKGVEHHKMGKENILKEKNTILPDSCDFVESVLNLIKPAPNVGFDDFSPLYRATFRFLSRMFGVYRSTLSCILISGVRVSLISPPIHQSVSSW